MKRYEVVREIANSCERNQMRDVLFFEVDTDDPVEMGAPGDPRRGGYTSPPRRAAPAR